MHFSQLKTAIFLLLQGTTKLYLSLFQNVVQRYEDQIFLSNKNIYLFSSPFWGFCYYYYYFYYIRICIVYLHNWSICLLQMYTWEIHYFNITVTGYHWQTVFSSKSMQSIEKWFKFICVFFFKLYCTYLLKLLLVWRTWYNRVIIDLNQNKVLSIFILSGPIWQMWIVKP